MTVGEQIDKLTIEQIINSEYFESLRVFKGFNESPDYWEIRMKAIKKDGKLFSMFGTEVNHPICLFFKEKITNQIK